LAWAYASDVSAPALPIIDTHIHLFDPTRPAGVPWPEPSDTVVYRPALPTRYRSLVVPFGVVGAIAVECSPWVEDNDWLLSAAASDPIIVGVIGNLDPAAPDFPRQLERLAANPLYRGIRYGNLWGRSLGTELSNPGFVANLKRLPASGLLLESANPNPTLIADILKLTDSVPELRIVIDHLPQAVPPAEPAARNGSDWPNSDHMAPYAGTFDIIRQYVTHKGQRASEKFFWKNSIAVYGWHQRSPAQHHLSG